MLKDNSIFGLNYLLKSLMDLHFAFLCLPNNYLIISPSSKTQVGQLLKNVLSFQDISKSYVEIRNFEPIIQILADLKIPE